MQLSGVLTIPNGAAGRPPKRQRLESEGSEALVQRTPYRVAPSSSIPGANIVVTINDVEISPVIVLQNHSQQIGTFFEICIRELNDIHERLTSLRSKSAIHFPSAAGLTNQIEETLCKAPLQESICLASFLKGEPDVATAIRSLNRHAEFLNSTEKNWNLTSRANGRISWLKDFLAEGIDPKNVSQKDLNQAISRYITEKGNSIVHAFFSIGYLEYTPASHGERNYKPKATTTKEGTFLQTKFTEYLSDSSNTDTFSETVKRFSQFPAVYVRECVHDYREQIGDDYSSPDSQNMIGKFDAIRKEMRNFQKQFIQGLQLPLKDDEPLRLLDSDDLKSYTGAFSTEGLSALEDYIDGIIGAIHSQSIGLRQGVAVGAQQGYLMGFQDAQLALLPDGQNESLLGLLAGSVSTWWSGGGHVRNATLALPQELSQDRIDEIMDSASYSSSHRLTDGSTLTLD